MKSIRLIYLIAVTLIAGIIRLWNLNHNPANLSSDEIILGHIVGPIINYQIWLLRLPFALLATLTIPLTIMFLWKQKSLPFSQRFAVGIWTGLLLAVSPWHILWSRRAQIIGNELSHVTLSGWTERFLAYLSPKYIFLTGDPVFLLSHHSGLLLSITLITIVIAFAIPHRPDRLVRISIVVILSGTALASTQKHLENAPALTLALFGWSVLAGWSITVLHERIRSLPKKTKYFCHLILIAVFGYQSLTSIHNSLVHSQQKAAASWELVYKPVAEYIVSTKNLYNQVLVEPTYSHAAKYIEWYSQGKLKKDSIIVEQYSDRYSTDKTLYIGPQKEKIKRDLVEFYLPTKTLVLYGGQL